MRRLGGLLGRLLRREAGPLVMTVGERVAGVLHVRFYMQNRRDHPAGKGTIDCPGISILEYGGNGKCCRAHDPDHARKHTRLDWGRGPEWTRGGRS